MSPETATLPAGLLHAAVLCVDPEELAVLAESLVRETLAAGGPVEVVLGRRGVRAFRDRLGHDADRVVFPSPATMATTPVPHRLDGVRSDPDGRRGLVIGRARPEDTRPDLAPGPADPADPAAADPSAAAPDPTADTRSDHDLGEDAVNLLLADVAATVLCVLDPAVPSEQALALRCHPWLLSGDGLLRNPEHRAPSASSPVPAELLGPSVARLPVPDGAALAMLRRQVGDAAAAAGLDPERAEATVLAAHEAMLLASGADLGTDLRGDLPPGEHVLDVRVTPGAVVSECRGTPPSGIPAAPADDPRFAHLSCFCDHATAHDDPAGRLVRVLTGTR